MVLLIGMLIIAVVALTLVTVRKTQQHSDAAVKRCSSIRAKDDVLLI